jgi:hypothetical protein
MLESVDTYADIFFTKLFHEFSANYLQVAECLTQIFSGTTTRSEQATRQQ